jgi:hypothetical protein
MKVVPIPPNLLPPWVGIIPNVMEEERQGKARKEEEGRGKKSKKDK